VGDSPLPIATDPHTATAEEHDEEEDSDQDDEDRPVTPKQDEESPPAADAKIMIDVDTKRQDDHEKAAASLPTPTSTIPEGDHHTPPAPTEAEAEAVDPEKAKQDALLAEKKAAQKAAKAARQSARNGLDIDFLSTFDPTTHWLPDGMNQEDYNPEFIKLLERHYWRNIGLGNPPMYGADLAGSLFDDKTREWNVAKLPSALSRLFTGSGRKVPGVNTPYLYWGMWRATFAWHVEVCC
jgi:hypothetical protein